MATALGDEMDVSLTSLVVTGDADADVSRRDHHSRGDETRRGQLQGGRVAFNARAAAPHRWS
jgi:hypothetical protein